MGIVTSAFDKATGAVGYVATGVENKVKNALAANQFDDVVDPERGILAKTVGSVGDLANIATLNTLRTVWDAGIKKQYTAGDLKAVNQAAHEGEDATVKERIAVMGQSEKGMQAVEKHAAKLDALLGYDVMNSDASETEPEPETDTEPESDEPDDLDV